jgi:hypothetical protein
VRCSATLYGSLDGGRRRSPSCDAKPDPSDEKAGKRAADDARYCLNIRVEGIEQLPADGADDRPECGHEDCSPERDTPQ